MPNWCSNSLKIVGDAKSIADFARVTTSHENHSETGIRLVNHYPMPQELADTPKGSFGESEKQKAMEEMNKANKEKYGFADWYDWSIANWGTKWSDCETELVHHFPTELLYRFDTAWSPPIPLIEKMSVKYPTLSFAIVYEELGMGFMGGVKIVDGETVMEEDIEIDSRTGKIELLSEAISFIPYNEDNEDAHYNSFYEALGDARDKLVSHF
jgi:hypothetical protein